MVPIYAVNRLLLAIAVTITFVLTALWDRGLLNFETAFRRLEARLQAIGFDWFASMTGRLGTDPLTLSMVIGLAVTLVYVALQLWGARADRAVLQGRMPGRLLAHLTARTQSTFEGLRTGGKDLVEMHFTFGRDSLLGPVKFAQCAFPVVGFIGTVIGVSAAVKRLPSAVQGGQMNQKMLNEVLDGLHVAFDTTFVGLAASVLVMVGLYFLDNHWDRNALIATKGREAGRASAGKDRASVPTDRVVG